MNGNLSTMIRTYKRKLILNNAQSQRIDRWIGVSRMVYNMALEIRIAAYRSKQQSVHKYELMKQLKDIKNVDWVKDVSSEVLKNTIERLDTSYVSFFKGNGFPKFAKKDRFNSISFKSVYGVKANHVKIPKLGWLKINKDFEIGGNPKTAIIKKEPTGYFVNIQCENVPSKFVSENQTIGLDMGISLFCVDSNGNFISNPRHFKKYERQLRIENRSLAKKHKGSNRWKKQAKKLALLHHKIGNVRKDFLHKESTNIAKRYSMVYIENLNIKGMSQNGKLSKHILDAGWGIFKTLLEYKTTVVKVNPAFTSQTCNECGAKDSESRISQSEFVCTSCGYISNADVNAAKNIKSKGIALGRKRESIDCALALESQNDIPESLQSK